MFFRFSFLYHTLVICNCIMKIIEISLYQYFDVTNFFFNLN